MDQTKIEQRVQLINNYITAYNAFDIDLMLSYLSEDIEFKNISHGELTDSTKGVVEFRLLAEQSKSLFSKREQQILNINLQENSAVVDILFKATMAIGTLEGLKAGQEISFKGSSSFTFKGDKISKIQDVS